MRNSDLINKIRTYEKFILAENKPTARFRAANYKKVAKLLETVFADNAQIKPSAIDQLDITDRMKSKLKDAIKGVPFRSKNDKPLNSIVKPLNKPTAKPLNKVDKPTAKPTNSTAKPLNKPTAKPLNKVDKPDKLLNELVAYMGIGQERAKQLIDNGLKNISQLNTKKYNDMLPEDTKMYLKLKPNVVIPRKAISMLEKHLPKGKAFSSIIVGSYRRQSPTSKDIDIMLVSASPTAIAEFLEKLKKQFVNGIFPYAQGSDKMSLIIDMRDMLPNETNPVYKIDVFRVLPENQAAMLLYSTGSKEFNIRMRGLAKKKGYLLNQNGLYRIVSDGKTKIVTETERDFFKELQMEYVEPADR